MANFNLASVSKDSNIEYSPTDLNMEYVKNIIHQRENPDPFIAFGLVAAVIMVMYLIYILIIKRNISGIWFGNIGDMPTAVKYKIIHNPFTDTLTIKIAGQNTLTNGKLIGHTIYLYNNVGNEEVGVLVGYHKIIWVNSKDVWNHVKLLE